MRPRVLHTAAGEQYYATDNYLAREQKRCSQYLQQGACTSSGCQFHGERCQPPTTAIASPSRMMARCAAVSPRTHGGAWQQKCTAQGCRADHGMTCVPRLRMTPRAAGRAAAPPRVMPAPDTPRIFIRGHGEAVLQNIRQDLNTGAQEYTDMMVAAPHAVRTLRSEEIRHLKWGLFGRLKLRPMPHILGERAHSRLGRQLLYDYSHSTEEVQHCMSRYCAEEPENDFCQYAHEGQDDDPPPAALVAEGIANILEDYCEQPQSQRVAPLLCRTFRSYDEARAGPAYRHGASREPRCDESDLPGARASAARDEQARQKSSDLDRDISAAAAAATKQVAATSVSEDAQGLQDELGGMHRKLAQYEGAEQHKGQACKAFADKITCGAQRKRAEPGEAQGQQRCAWHKPRWGKEACIDAGTAWFGKERSATGLVRAQGLVEQEQQKKVAQAMEERRTCKIAKQADCEDGTNECVWSNVPWLGNSGCKTRADARKIANKRTPHNGLRQKLCVSAQGTWEKSLFGGNCRAT